MPKFFFILILISITTINSYAQNIGSLLYNWQDSSLVGSWAYNNIYNEVWGVTINGHEIGIIGSTEGTHFFDITDPNNITKIGFISGAYTGGGVIHRDYHDYNGYLYVVCDEGNSSTLQIIDLKNLPYNVSLVYDSNTLFSRAHNIFIDTATAKLYVCANNNNAMDIYSIDNPLNPSHLFSYNDVGHVHDAYVKNDTAFLNCGYEGLKIIDFHYLDTPGNTGGVELASFTSYPDAGYNHSGWLSNDGTIYVMKDENHGYDIKILDVSDFNNISVLSTFNSGIDDSSMAHNGIIVDEFLYVSYYHDGFIKYNISDPYNPFIVCMYDTYAPNNHSSYKGAWGVYPNFKSGNILVSDMQSGLFLLNCSSNSNTSNYIETNKNIIYPNPSSGIINLNNDIKEIEIYDIFGKLIFKKNIFGDKKISYQFKKGAYLSKIKLKDNSIINEKLIIK